MPLCLLDDLLSLLEHCVWPFTNTNCLEFSVTRGKQAFNFVTSTIDPNDAYNHANKKIATNILTILCELVDKN